MTVCRVTEPRPQVGFHDGSSGEAAIAYSRGREPTVWPPNSMESRVAATGYVVFRFPQAVMQRALRRDRSPHPRLWWLRGRLPPWARAHGYMLPPLRGCGLLSRGESATGQRYIGHGELGYTPLLFVREFKRMPSGLAAPYAFLGPAEYVSHEGSRPISVVWRLKHPIPARLLRPVTRQAAG